MALHRHSSSRAAWLRRLLAGVVVAGLLAAAAPLRGAGLSAAQPSPITLAAVAGFDGYYKESRWVPVRVTVGNDGPDVRGSLGVAVRRANSAEVVIRRDLELPTQSRREIFLYVPVEGFTSSLRVSLVVGGQVAADATVRIVQATPNDLIYGVLAGSPSAFNVLADIDPLNGTAYVAQLSLADLPPVAAAWQSLDVLVVSDVDTGALTPEQRAALSGWVASGGRLMVAGGPGWQRTAAGLAPLLPLTPSGTQTVDDTSSLGSFAVDAAPGSGVAAVGSLHPEAVTLAASGSVPLIVSRSSGYGQVVYLALDPAFDPLRNWTGLEGLFRNILSSGGERPGWAAGPRQWYSARDAVNALPGLDFPSTFQICGFLGIYLLAVGPVNYFVLSRLKRREMAWLTIPGIVLLFSVGAYITGNQLRGAQAVLHRLSVVQVWPDAEHARVDQILGLFSPRRADYDLAFAEGLLARPMPIDNFGAAPSSYTVHQADQTTISDVRMEVGGVEPFVVQGQVPAPAFASTLTLEATRSGLSLQGTVTNNSDLALTDVVLLAPGGVQRLGNLGPGDSASISLSLTNSRASAASMSTVLPVVAGQALAVPQPVFPPGPYDTTVDDIMGNVAYYSDRNLFRRYALLNAVIDPYSGGVRGGGVYLVGWADAAPIESSVVGRSYAVQDVSVYFVHLRPTLSLTDNLVAIPPGLMTWVSADAARFGPAGPYDLYVYQGSEYILRFMPSRLVPFQAVQGLTLHLTAYGATGPASVNVELWDQALGEWVPQGGLQWGDNAIADPSRYVGPAGDVQVRVTGGGQTQTSIERLDFTLLVER